MINLVDTTSMYYHFFTKIDKMGVWSAISAISALLGVLIAFNFVKMRAYDRGLNFYIYCFLN